MEKKRKFGRKLLSMLLCVVMIAAMVPLVPVTASAAIDYGDLTIEQPVLLVTGQGIGGSGRGSAANVSNEKSYTLAELQALGEDAVVERVYSALSSGTPPNMRIYRGVGVDVEELLQRSGYTDNGEVTFLSNESPPRSQVIDLSVPRYYYPEIINDTDESPIKAMLAWRTARDTGTYPSNAPTMPPIPDPFSAPNSVTQDASMFQLMVGQPDNNTVTANLYNSRVNHVRVGSAITGPDFTVSTPDGDEVYTRADLLLMPRAERTYDGTRVRGVPLAYLLEDLPDTAEIEFASVDNWVGISDYIMTKAELVERNAILAYELWNAPPNPGGWSGYYRSTDNGAGYFRLWIDDLSGAHAINKAISPDPSKPRITITQQPIESANFLTGNISGALTISATVTQGAELSYQWWRNTSASTTTGNNLTAIAGATDTSYTIPTDLPAGTWYYHCRISAPEATTRLTSTTIVVVVDPPPPPSIDPQWVGDAGPGSGRPPLITIEGAVEQPGYFTQAGLLTYTSYIQTKTYNHRNSNNTTGSQTVTGIYLEDLLTNIMTLSPGARSITLIAGDGIPANYNLNSSPLGVYSTDIQGNKMMLYFDGVNMRLAVGQTSTEHTNRILWLQNVRSITVNTDSITNPGTDRPSWQPDEEDEEDVELPELPTISVEAETPTAEQVAAAEEAVAEAIAHGAENSITIYPTGDPVVVATGTTEPTKTNVTGVEATGATVMAIVNADGTLTPVPTKVEADGSVTVLITGDVVLVPLHVEADFNDVAGHWGEDEINKAASLMIVEGTGGGKFDPTSEVTGAEAVTMFLRALGFPVDDDAPEVPGIDQDKWYAGAVNTAADAGLAVNVDPEKPMTRLQTAKLIYSALEAIGMKPAMTLDKAKEAIAAFSDLGGLTNEEIIYMGVLVELGIFKGKGDGTMDPDGILMRDQMASLAVRFQSLIFS